MFLGVVGGGGCNPGEQKQRSGEQSDPPLPSFSPVPPFIRPHRLPAEQRKRSPSDTPGRSSFFQSCLLGEDEILCSPSKAERQAKNGVGRSRRAGGADGRAGGGGWRANVSAGW